MARVAVDMWGNSIVAFSGKIQKLLTAEVTEKFQESAEKTIAGKNGLCGGICPYMRVYS
jgi:hypothetical protein